MSSLQCPATLVLARHGDADYVESHFSDEGGSLTHDGRTQSRDLAAAVSDRRIAHVWSSDASRAVQTAEIVAAALGVGVTARKSLREVHVGDLMGRPFSVDAVCAVTDRWFDGDLAARFTAGESGLDVVARYREELASIADAHPGETVLVVGHQTALGIALPLLAANVSPAWAEHRLLENGEFAELVIDAEDWRLTRWGGHRF